MADLYSTAATVTNAGATAVTVGENARKIEVGAQLGTRELQFLEIAAVEDNSAVDFTKADLAETGSYLDAGSLMSKAVNALQGFGEVYIVGTPSATEFVVALATDTLNGAEVDSNVDAETYGAMEAAIDSAIGIGTGTHSVTVTPLALTGDDLS